MRRTIPAAFAATLLLGATAAAAGDVSVPMDEVQMISFTRPVLDRLCRQSSIADVTVIDSTHVFVLGRAFGRTNLIALGPDGRQVSNDRINVYGRGGSTVTVQRGVNAVTYACAAASATQPRCQAIPPPCSTPSTARCRRASTWA